MKKVFASIETWKSKLEDTSKRNRAINFKETKLSQIKIINPDIKEIFSIMRNKNIEFAELFESYEDNKDYEIEQDEFYVQGQMLPKKEVYSYLELKPSIQSFLNTKKRTSKRFLFTNRPLNLQNRALRSIESTTRLFLEENAINIGYLTLGMVKWREDVNSNVYYKAPLFFIPVEITQESFNAPYKLGINDEEMSLNNSFVQMLEQMFDLKIDFEMDEDKTNFENYMDYKKYFQSKITDNKWDLNDDVHLSSFTFSKINMLNDLNKNHDEIINNKLIQMLAGKEVKHDQYPELSEELIDEKLKPSEYFRTLDADSSQEMAIEAAIRGQSFVLQGPPGTGKSQTITNIISELIARGKKVLFVAEKKAALDVVYNNLRKVDLHEFALPIHNKATRPKELVMELNETLVNGQNIQDYHESDIKQLESSLLNAKTNLNNYANTLIKIRKPLNKSVYELYGLFSKYSNQKEHRFNIEYLNTIDTMKFSKIEDLISSFIRLHKQLDYKVVEHPWYGLDINYLNSLKREELELNLNIIITNLKKLHDYFINNHLKLEKTDKMKLMDLNKILELYQMFEKTTYYDYDLLSYIVMNNMRLDHMNEDLIKIKELINLNEIINNKHNKITKHYHFEVLSENIEKYEFITRTKTTFFEKLFSKDYRNLKKTLKKYFVNKKRKNNDLKLDILNMKNYIEKAEEKKSLYSKIAIFSDIRIRDKEYEELKNKLSWLINIFSNIDNTSYSIDNDYVNLFESIFNNHIEFIEKSNSFNNIIETLLEHIKLLQNDFDVNEIDFININIDDFNSKINKMNENKDHIQNYINFKNSYKDGINLGIKEYLDYIIENKLTDNIQDIFNRRFYQLLIDEIISNDEILKNFMMEDYENFRNTFKLRDKEMINMAKVRVKSLIRHRYPAITGINSHNVEISLLRREANKSRRHLPIRRLIENMPDLITTLKPVLMMSPLSVSTYLINSDLKFDVVIFDEASQVTPESAIGAIYRSKQAIIVGDKEQLPPTNFFESSYESDESDELYSEVEDFSSILELASGSITNVPLTWHYRSKYEDLIEPSNNHIYKNLITFPSPEEKKRRTGLEFIKVDGIYANRENTIEAQKVTKLILEHFDEFKHERSIGVVTFNQSQLRAIENELDKVRRENTKYEEFFDRDLKEPFFIKNIETVQGDERDTIIASVSYGPTPTGKISMNFGPINKEGGYRRLNVAFTRAKQNLILVSSITEKDIDLNRTQQRGVIFLKEYLRFAEFGNDLKIDDINHFADFDSAFEEDVYNEIEKMGYKVDKQVGSSGYKIDLAIRDENYNYILGIECDGATYHNSKSARNRDRLRQDVLETRGWNIYRIWSTDWFKNRSTEIKKLQEAIQSYINGVIIKEEIDNNQIIELRTIIKEELEPEFDNYPEHQNIKIYHSHFSTKIQGIYSMITKLSPIHFNELKKIIPKFYGRQKFTNVVEREFNSDLRHVRSKNFNIRHYKDFLIDTNQEIKFRKYNDTKDRRDFLNIHIEEIKHGLLEVTKIAERINKDILYRQIIDYSGYSTISANFRTYLDEALNELVLEKKVLTEDEVVEYIKQ